MAQDTEVDIKLFGRLGKFYALVLGDESGVMPKIMAAWTRIYAAFTRRRFVKASRGDGTWEPLAPRTIARRRKRSAVILRDTGMLFAQLSPELQHVGPVSQQGLKFLATVSFGGHGKYPDGLTTTEVMTFHQAGHMDGYLPQRKIIVDADEQTQGQMRRAADRIIKEYLLEGP